MSEYWVSKARYFCTYCKIYIADDKPSRISHETGLRHKGNLERYIRDIYKKGAQKDKEKAQEARDIAAIDAAAAKAMGISVEQASSLQQAQAGPSSAPAVKKEPAKPSAWRGSIGSYSTATDLGFEDPEAARIAAEKAAREKEGRAGDWQYVSVPQATSLRRTPAEEDAQQLHPPDDVKRRISFAQLSERTLPSYDDDDDNYSNIAIKVKKREAPSDSSNATLGKAIKQAKLMGPEASAVKARAPAHNVLGVGKFKPVQSGDFEQETEEQIEERNKSAWHLIAPSEEAQPEQAEAATTSTDVPVFKKRKTGSAAVSRHRPPG